MQQLPIYHLSFPTHYLLTSTFLRFQEHYESPEFRDKVFTWEEFMDWYAATNGKFSYLEDWAGFNIPDTVLKRFYAYAFDPLTVKERRLLERFRDVPRPFYIIGTTAKTETDALLHEIVHGLFYVFPDYGAAVRECVARFDTARLRACLEKKGYAENTMDDEINAYLLTGLAQGMRGRDNMPIRHALQETFREHFGASIRGKKMRERLHAAIQRIDFDPLSDA